MDLNNLSVFPQGVAASDVKRINVLEENKNPNPLSGGEH